MMKHLESKKNVNILEFGVRKGFHKNFLKT